MDRKTDGLRERLLATLPEPESLAAYREEIAALLKKHARALRWDYITVNTFYVLAGILLFASTANPYWRPDAAMRYSFHFGAAFLFFVGMIYDLRYRIYNSQVATLKEVKQVQLQMLELQEDLRKDRKTS
ncbi:MAG: hypothetical protein WBF42_02465 [Terracidiphilus sp.]